MVKLGKSSKRTPVRLRHKIEKAGAAKQRKQRKLAKKDPQWRSKLKKDPGIPNLFPFKDKLLHEIEERKRLKEEEASRIREEARQRRQLAKSGNDAEERTNLSAQVDDELIDDDVDVSSLVDEDDVDMDGDESNPMAALLASAKARAAEFDDENMVDEDDSMDEDESDGGFGEDGGVRLESNSGTRETSRRAFDKAFKEVIDRADVVLYVLDARDPEGTRSKEVEREIMAADSGSKRLILILNKIDLVPSPVLKGWLQHLRRYFPTLPLRASTGAANAHTFDHKQLTVKGTSETLFKALKTYAHNKQLQRSISVGVIGYPNVGKSSVINSLTSRMNRGNSNVCPVGAEAGVTTSLREVKLDNKLKIIDSPGIVFPNSGKEKQSSSRKINEQARLILLNAIPPKQISDPVPAVTLLLKRLSSSESLLSNMLGHYGIPPLVPTNGDLTNDFLIQVARKRGRLGRGGVPNISSAATTVITDWRDGRIQGWLEAPALAVSTASSSGAAGGNAAEVTADTKEVVTEWAKEFQLEGLWGDASNDQMME